MKSKTVQYTCYYKYNIKSYMSTDSWKVIKLGGTSQCKKGYDELINQLMSYRSDQRFVIVLSAISGVTDLLEKYTQTSRLNA